MKKLLFIIVLGLFFAMTSLGQIKQVSQTAKDTIVPKKSELLQNMDITIGYVPRSPYNALKTSFSVNNIFFKRFGFYGSLEKGLDTDYFAGTLGVTSYIHQYVYLWGGVGIFSTYKSENKNFWSTYRKEFGVGFTPYKRTVIRLGWSLTVGPTIAAGFLIPLQSVSKYPKIHSK